MRPGPRRSLRGLLLRSRGAAEIRAGAELGGRSDRGPEALPVSAADTPPGLTLAGLPEIRAEILAGIWKPRRCRREDESPACPVKGKPGLGSGPLRAAMCSCACRS